MKLLEDLNNDQFLKDAFDEELNQSFTKKSIQRRNFYLSFFLTGIVCIFMAAFANHLLLCMLSLGLATLSLVLMTKYDTQIRFLRSIKQQITKNAEALKAGPGPID